MLAFTGAIRKAPWSLILNRFVCESCPFHKSGQCRAKPGKRDKRYHLDFNLHEVQVARRRRAKDQQRHSGKNLRAAVEATMRTIKHPFPAGKLPVRGLFRVTSLIVGSALMGNVRSILRYEKAKFKKDQSQIVPKEQEKGSSEQSILSFLRWHWLRMKAFVQLYERPLSCFSC